MKAFSIKRALILITVMALAAMTCFTMQDAWVAEATQTTKAVKKAKKVTLNLIIKAEKDSEVELTIEKKTKKKSKNSAISKTLELKKGMNYFTYNKGKKGNYTVSLIAYGDTVKQKVTAVQGAYTMYFTVAPPDDSKDKKDDTIEYKDITKL